MMTEETATKLRDAVNVAAKMVMMAPIPDIVAAYDTNHTSRDVDRLLHICEQWNTAFNGVADIMEKPLNVVDSLIKKSNDLKVALRPSLSDLRGFTEIHADLKSVVETLDRLEKHRQSGLLDVLTSLKKQP